MCTYVKIEQDEIGNTLMQLQDQQKLMEKHFISALEQLNKSLQQVIQSNASQQARPIYQAPMPVYQAQVPQMHQRGMFVPRINTSSCFYYDEDGHIKDDCPHHHKHLEKGWIIIDAHGRAMQPDGRMIPFTGGNTIKI